MTLKILTHKQFESEIKNLIKEKAPITMLDAILLYCEEKNIEVETAASLITPKMKSTIEGEAIKAKMITSNKARLPIEEE